MKPFSFVLLALTPLAVQGGEPTPAVDRRFAQPEGTEVPSFQRHVVPLLGRHSGRCRQGCDRVLEHARTGDGSSSMVGGCVATERASGQTS